MLLRQVRSSVLMLLVLTVITGVFYPLFVTAIAQLFFSNQANGSLIIQNGKPVGSALIGQPFDRPEYFWSRPSATGPFAYNAAASSGSNLGPTNKALLGAVKGRVAALQQADPTNKLPVPVDLVTASASGLDPEISPAAAYYQVPRIARVRKLAVAQVESLVKSHTQDRFLGLIGEQRVNVLQLNLALDK